MKYLLLILCASLFSVLATAETPPSGVNENPGGIAKFPSDAPAVVDCNCGAVGSTLLTDGSNAMHPTAAASPAVTKPGGSAKDAEKHK